MTASQVHATYPAYQADLIGIKHFNFSNIVLTSSGGNDTETFNSELQGQVSLGGSPYIPIDLTGPVSVEEFGHTGMTTGTFNTQMLSMDMTGNVAGHSVEIMLDPTNPTLGQTMVDGAGGGLFRIDSFFDVFTELSIDHGPFVPSTGAARVDLLPEPTSLGLLGIGAFALCTRRRRKA
jgi:hypothetical protein